jgi:putative DNA methylase
MQSSSYPKRLIEVDLPIKKISEHARREKAIRHGHISTLHIWWARRPLAACRAVICASLWPDPADPICPESFKAEAKRQMGQFWNQIDPSTRNIDDPIELRKALLDFIADFSNWDNSTDERYFTTARKLTQSAHEALGGELGTRPLVVDPFAGGGSIPLEALRVGADAYASDLNPVSVLLNKVVLEYIPKFGLKLADEVRKWGKWVEVEAEKELLEFYPKDPDGSTPIAYLWARTIHCEGPGCGTEVPLLRSLWLAKKGDRSVALRLIPNKDRKIIDFEIIESARPSDVKDATMRRGSVTCPCCGYTTPVASVRRQLKVRHGGTNDARMYCVVTTKKAASGRFYRLPTTKDLNAVVKAKEKLDHNQHEWKGKLSLVPNESTSHYHTFVNRGPIYGMITWADYFTPRQLLTLSSFVTIVTRLNANKNFTENNKEISPIQTCLGIAIDRCANQFTSLSKWNSGRELVDGVFARQAIPMLWDFGEIYPFNGDGYWIGAIEWIAQIIDKLSFLEIQGKAELASATAHPLPNDSAQCFMTDPPYYYSVQYADLSDFFYVWLHRSIGEIHPTLFNNELSPKTEEIIVQSPAHEFASEGKNKQFYESRMHVAMEEGRRILAPNGIGIVVFANTSTAGWETMLQSLVESGWVITGSWPIDTELASRVLAQNRSVLASSIHLICRPRENPEGSSNSYIGEWSDVLAELPVRIHEWMPRLKEENVVGADAIFACLGPALEIFSRYSRVEKASGEQVALKEYLEKVWEAVEKEALKVIFEGADASGFEEDARLTAMWLWTLKAGTNGEAASNNDTVSSESEEDIDGISKEKASNIVGYGLEYDAARKISQGLGAHLEDMPTLIEIKKGNARLLSVEERVPYLFGKQDLVPKRKLKKRDAQLTLFPSDVETDELVTSSPLGDLSAIGKTSLDRVHQSMLLFGNGQSEPLKRFLVEDGVGKDPQFKKLAQALVALYPAGSNEKRWAEGVMSRMKGLGL